LTWDFDAAMSPGITRYGMRCTDAEALLHGLERMENVTVAPVRDVDQAVRLAAVISTTGLDPCDAHVAAVADASVCAILTLDGAKWQEHAKDLDEPLRSVRASQPA
jgi:predicted nucleic acid-binding protein